MPRRFIDVLVDEHDDIPDGCMVRFHAIDEPRSVRLIRYTPLVGAPGLFRIEARARTGDPGPARAVSVEDPGAGTSTLICGGDLGLRLFRATTDGALPGERDEPIAEPYLLLAADGILS